jgi:hypothetical protein
MRTWEAGKSVPPELQSTYDMVICAFSGHPPREAYRPMLVLLSERMSFRGLADILCLLFDVEWPVAYNDAPGGGWGEATSEEIDAVRRALVRCGYADWLRRRD